MNRTGRRRLALLLLAVVVAALHGAAALLLPPVHLGDGEHMPKRIEVAYVREMAPAAPPAAPPVVVPRRRAPRAAPAPPPKPAASVPAEPVLTAEAPAAAASAASAADALAEAAPTEAGPQTEPLTEPADASTAAAEDAAASAVAAAASAAASAPAFEWPPSTRLSYSLHGNYRGEVLGAAMVEWVRAGSRYQVHLDVWIGAQAAPLVGRRMTSDGDLTEQGLVPRRYDEETRALFRELRRRTIRFEADRIVLPNGKELARPEGVQDAASQFVQLTWLFTTRPDLLRVGRRIELPLALPTKVVTWPYDIIGTATLDTPLGPIETFHVRPQKVARPGGDLVAEAWFAPSLAYLPIRLMIRQDESTYADLQLDRAPLQEAARSGAVPRAPRTLGAGDEPK